MLSDSVLYALKDGYGEEALVDALCQARNYLRDNLEGVGAAHEGHRIYLDLTQWGSEGVSGSYTLCLASMWWLLQTGQLLTNTSGYYPSMAYFIDSLRWPAANSLNIKELLGVVIPLNLSFPREWEPDAPPSSREYTLSNWDASDPHLVLQFLDWLVMTYYNKED